MSSEIEKIPVSVPSGDTHNGDEPTRLRGNMGVRQLLFTVLAYNSPLGASAAMVPLVIAFGGGIHAPLLYLGFGLLLAIFAVGYSVMSRELPRAGAFYTYVTAGLGRPLGLATSFIAIFTYTTALIGTFCFVGLATRSLVATTFNGPEIPWWVWTLGMVAVAAVFGVRRIDFSARVVGYFVLAEVVVVAAYDIAVGGSGGGAGHLTFGSFNPGTMSVGAAVAGLVFVTASFSGFEATAVFRDEVREPRRTIPIATYLAITLIALFYGLVSWLMVQAYGETDAVTAISADPSSAFLNSVNEHLGRLVYDIGVTLLVTSTFASLVALHNIISRYVFNLGIDGVLPRSLGKPHPRIGSPHVASSVVSLVTLGAVVIFAATSLDPVQVYVKLFGLGGYGMVILMALAAIGIAAYLIRKRPADASVWHRLIAPLIAAAGLVALVAIVTDNIDLLTGSSSLSRLAIILLIVCLTSGVLVALVFRAKRPEVYQHIGTRE